MSEKRHTDNQLKEIFCASNGYLSSKRVLGAIVLMGCLITVIVEASREGITDNIKSLIEYLTVTSTCLLGITSVAGIFKSDKAQRREEDC